VLDFERIAKVSRIGLMGVIDPRKNQMAALEALKILKDRYSHPVELHLIGDIKDKEYYLSLIQYIERNGLEEQVIFTGNLEEPLLYLAGVDVFLFVPVSEGFGLAVLEAMSFGLPVVSSFTEGAREFLEKGKNFIEVDHHDPRSIADGIFSLKGNPELIKRLSKQSRKTAEKYDFENSLKGYLRLYRGTRNTKKDTKG
jgi:glycosyltransferase involved in cell wall biosynthesis